MKAARLLEIAAAGALACVAGVAAAQPIAGVGERPIARADVATFVGEQFGNADADKDGAVTRAELQAFRAGLESRDQAAFDEIAAQSFEQADIDGDGEIARWEVDQRAMQLFDMVDVDGSGIASVEEQMIAATLLGS